jgi:hypothetical protein
MKVTCPRCGLVHEISPRRTPQASRFFHAACGRYASAMGMTAEDAKVLFKWHYGVWVPMPFRDGPPEWPGRFYRMYKGQQNEILIFAKSEAAYTKAEERALVDGVKTEAWDAGVDLSDLFDE